MSNVSNVSNMSNVSNVSREQFSSRSSWSLWRFKEVTRRMLQNWCDKIEYNGVNGACQRQTMELPEFLACNRRAPSLLFCPTSLPAVQHTLVTRGCNMLQEAERRFEKKVARVTKKRPSQRRNKVPRKRRSSRQCCCLHCDSFVLQALLIVQGVEGLRPEERNNMWQHVTICDKHMTSM